MTLDKTRAVTLANSAFASGIVTAVISVFAYVIVGMVYLARSIMGATVSADRMAIPLLLFLFGLVLAFAGKWAADYIGEQR